MTSVAMRRTRLDPRGMNVIVGGMARSASSSDSCLLVTKNCIANLVVGLPFSIFGPMPIEWAPCLCMSSRSFERALNSRITGKLRSRVKSFIFIVLPSAVCPDGCRRESILIRSRKVDRSRSCTHPVTSATSSPSAQRLLAQSVVPAPAVRDTGSMVETVHEGVTLRVVQGDITTMSVDVIVNAANSSLLGGGGVDGAIHRAAGPELLDACRDVVARQGGCATGEAVITQAGALAADHVIHTVGPVWTGKSPQDHDALLTRCYTESLRLAVEAGATTVAFPNISTGVYRFPLERAASMAVAAVRAWIAEPGVAHNLSEITFVCFTDENVALYADLLG